MRKTNRSTARIGRNVSSRRWNDKDVREQYSIRRNGRGKNILYRYSYRQNQRINSKLSRKTLAFWKICKQTLSCKEAYSEN